MDHIENVGGWLLVPCAVLLLWQPAQFAVAAVMAMEAVAVRGAAVLVVLAARLIVTAFGAAAGFAIMRKRQAAIRLTIAVLLAAAAVDVFVELTSFFPTNRVPGDAPYYAAASAIVHGGLAVYMARSSRVRRTLTS
ncbi:MAG TPA: DUF2569 family protein [Vicinamibacterales bacterium]|jgi:hypothetical protein